MAGADLSGIDSLQETIREMQSDLGGDDVTYRIVTNVSYAPYVEYGTSEMAAQPYLRPAANAVRSEIPGIVRSTDSVEDAVRTVALRCLRKAKQYCPVDTGLLRASIRIERRSGGSWSPMGSFDGGIDLGSGETSGEVSA